MKKLFSLVILMLASLTLFACDQSVEVPQDDTPTDVETETITITIEGDTTESFTIELEEDNQSLFDYLIDSLTVEYTDTEYGPMITSIESISADENHYIGFYKNGDFAQAGVGTIDFEDGDTFTFRREELMQYVTIEIIDNHETETLYAAINNHADMLSVLESVVTVEYDTTDYGPMLTRVGDLSISPGNCIQMDKNQAMAIEGIGTIDFTEGDVFTFTLEWWDPSAYMLDTIDLFETNYLTSYLDTHNYYLLSAYNHLDRLKDFSFDAPTYDTESDLFSHIKYILAAEAFSLDTSDAEANLLNLATIGHLYSGSLISLVTDDANFQTDYVNYIDNTDLASLDLDTLSLVLLALNKLGNETYDETIIDIITTDLYTSEYGNNAATFAHVIIALISAGIDPTRDTFNHEDNSLIDYFMAFHGGDGSFYYQLGDDNPDMMFTTPQALLAVTMYYQYLQTGTSVHPFIYE